MFNNTVDTFGQKKQCIPFAKLFKFRKRERSTKFCNYLKVSTLLTFTKLEKFSKRVFEILFLFLK